MKNIRLTLSLILLALVFIFAFQNAELLQVRFLFWSIETRRIFILLATLIIGFVLGWAFRAHADTRKAAAPSVGPPD
ncbi:MAG TPA: LapA family protein [Alphaproteobacteria bacterium]|nr:LapA family protein [Alphaproteobacteria bacterium]